jgi:ketosteroid isomerase-like protein
VTSVGRSDRFFFSVWRTQPDGSWKVAVDLGTPVDLTPRDPFDDVFVAAPPTRWRGPAGPAGELERLDASMRDAAGFVARLAEWVRGLRFGVAPLVGRAAFEGYHAARPGTLAYEPLGSGLSRAGDMGYSYGRYTIGVPAAESGDYARVWVRDAAGAWGIAFDVARPHRPRQGE